jgi:hypothetical protein
VSLGSFIDSLLTAWGEGGKEGKGTKQMGEERREEGHDRLTHYRKLTAKVSQATGRRKERQKERQKERPLKKGRTGGGTTGKKDGPEDGCWGGWRNDGEAGGGGGGGGTTVTRAESSVI